MYKLNIVLTDEERSRLNAMVKESGLSISDFVRKTVFEKKSSGTWQRNALPILADMSTDINKYRQYGADEYIDDIERGVKELWQILS